jgi:hypothetical protein
MRKTHLSSTIEAQKDGRNETAQYYNKTMLKTIHGGSCPDLA